jgi:hypothetical protein
LDVIQFTALRLANATGGDRTIEINQREYFNRVAESDGLSEIVGFSP